MSKDLSFWKYERTMSLKDGEVYVKLSDGEFVDGVAELPKDDILKSLDCALKNWTKMDDTHYENGNELVEVYITTQFVRFDCYNVSENHMNLLMDVMFEYDCPLYDSAIDVRFV